MAKSYEFGIIISATDRATKVLSRVSSRMRLIESATSRASAKMAAIGAKATAAAVGMGYAFSRPIKSAMDFESAMADVKKVVNFDGAADFKNFGNEIVRMSTRIPIAADGLAQIAAAGGQLGIAKKDLMGFTETVAKMSTAFDMLPDEAGDAIAKMMNVYSLNLDQVTRLGDAINYLSDNTAAKSRDIVNYLKRVGGMAKTFGMSATSAAALGDALLGLGTPVEVAARGTNQILRRLMTADHQGKKFQKGLKHMGLSARKVMRMVKKDADGTILWLLKRLKGMDSQEMMGVISDMFGAEWAPMVANLVQHIDQYKETMRMAGDKTLYAGSMQREFANRAATTANKLQLLRSSFTAIGINLGSVFLPKIQKVVDKIRVVTDRLGEWAAAHPKLAEKMGGATAKIIAITAAIGGVSLVIAGVVKAVGLLFAPIRLAVGALWMLGKAFVSVAKVAVIKGSVSIDGIGAAIRAVGVLGGAVLAVGSAFVWLNDQIAKAGKQEIDDKRVMGKSLEQLKAQRQRVAEKLEEMRNDRGFLGTGLGAPDKHEIAAQEARLKRLDAWIGKIERGEAKAPSNEPKMPDYMRKFDEMMGKFREYQDQAIDFYKVVSGEKSTTRSIARMGMAGAGSVMIAAANPAPVVFPKSPYEPSPAIKRALRNLEKKEESGKTPAAIQVKSPSAIPVKTPPQLTVRSPGALTVGVNIPSQKTAPFQPAQKNPQEPVQISLPKQVGEDHDATRALQSGMGALRAQYESLAQSTQSQIKGVEATVQAVANRPEQHTYHVQVTVNGTTASPAEIQAAMTQALSRAHAQKQTRSMRDEK